MNTNDITKFDTDENPYVKLSKSKSKDSLHKSYSRQ